MKRQHPCALFGYTTKNFWLLVFPLVRGLAALSFDFYRWAEGAAWDILIVTLMIAIACIRWYFTQYEFTENSVNVTSGMFIRRNMKIPFESVSAVTCEVNPVFAPFAAERVYIDTDASTSSRKSADLNLMITKSERARLVNSLSEVFSDAKGSKEQKMNYTYKVSKKSLVIFSLLFSSALSGVVLLVTAISGGADIIGDRLEQNLLTAVNSLSDAVANFLDRIIHGISPAGIAISIVIGVGFLISFIGNIMRHISFKVTRRGSCIIISNGLFIKRIYCLNSKKINISDMRQNLLMKLFGITSVHINCTGYGKRKNEFPVFVPICSIKSISREKSNIDNLSVLEMLLPGFTAAESYINPEASYVMRFIGPPALLVFGVIAAGLLSLVYFTQWHSLIAFLTVLLEIPAIWLLFAKACSYCTNGINISKGCICAKYCKWYDFHTITVPLERVAEIRITQTVFQRMNKSCDVIIYTNSEYIGSHRVRSMPITEVQELIADRY